MKARTAMRRLCIGDLVHAPLCVARLIRLIALGAR